MREKHCWLVPAEQSGTRLKKERKSIWILKGMKYLKETFKFHGSRMDFFFKHEEWKIAPQSNRRGGRRMGENLGENDLLTRFFFLKRKLVDLI